MKRCPFCGGDRIAVLTPSVPDEYMAACLDCCAYGPPAGSDEGARSAWNQRAGQPREDAQPELFA